MLQTDPFPESPVPVAEMPSDANPFNRLKGNNVMKVINAELVPIMIETEGNHWWFTTDTLSRALRGRKVEMTNFTTKVLANIGEYHFLHFFV